MLCLLTPRAFAATSASFARREIALRFYCATKAMIPTARSFASRISQAKNPANKMPAGEVDL